MPSTIKRSLALGCGLVLIVAGLYALSGCEKKGNQFAAPPPPEVTVAQPLKLNVTQYVYFTGRTQAVEVVELRPQVKGILTGIHFGQGQKVERGQLL